MPLAGVFLVSTDNGVYKPLLLSRYTRRVKEKHSKHYADITNRHTEHLNITGVPYTLQLWLVGSYHSIEDITTPTNSQCISTVKKENHEWDEGGNKKVAPVNFQQSRTLFLYTSRLFRNIRYVARRNHYSRQRRPPKQYNRPAESFQASSPLDHFKVEYYKALQL